MEDLTGETFGRLMVLASAGIHETPGGTRRPLVKVRCVCGREKTVMVVNLRNGRTTSCGIKGHRPSPLKRDLTGQKFGRLLVLREVSPYIVPATGESQSRWAYLCDCGSRGESSGSNLVGGNSQSCGCSLKKGVCVDRWIEVTGYCNAHRRVRRLRGSASTHPCVDCGESAREWSYIGGDPNQLFEEIAGALRHYSLDPEFYVPRCKRCHGQFDREARNLSKMLLIQHQTGADAMKVTTL